MVRPLARDEDALSPLWSFVGVLVLVFAVLAVYFGVIIPKFPPPAPRALPGDTVSVNYIGTFENGLVFDTSLASVAEDNASFPKAFAFSWRGSWPPLSFEIGKQPPAVILGFEGAVQGLAVGDTITARVPPDQGYGPADPAKVQVKPLFESVPAKVTMNASAFRATYGTDAVGGSIVKDPLWGWTATVDVAGSIITVTNRPVPGDIVHPRGAWDARVLSIDSAADGGAGQIQVHHLLDASSVDRVGRRTGGSSGTVEFTVTAVDLDAGTYTLNFNDPTKGRVLVFQVTLVHITSV
jgi:FKBP-type peptidyl-prolyl cis-trans isomerase 2